MPKSFSETEKNIIRQSLIEEYKKSILNDSDISVSKLTSNVGISKGSFYAFYECKELLFVDVIKNTTNQLKTSISEILNNNGISGKQKLKNIFFFLYSFAKKNPWIKNISGIQYNKIIRKLPVEIQKSLIINHEKLILNIIDKTGVDLKIPKKEAADMIQLILFTLPYNEMFDMDYLKSYTALVDAAIENMMEE